MNTHTHRTIYNHTRGCLMAVAETAKSSGKASGGRSAPRKARTTLHLGNPCPQVKQVAAYSLPHLQIQSNSALSRRLNKGYSASQLGSDPHCLPLRAVCYQLACGREW
jgi:hypothetical protein